MRIFVPWILLCLCACTASSADKSLIPKNLVPETTSTNRPQPTTEKILPTQILPEKIYVTQEKKSSTQDYGRQFNLYSPIFSNGEAIPSFFTCEGRDISPPLKWSYPPQGTKSFILLMTDPDAPGGTFVHWILYNIPEDCQEITQDVTKAETVEGIGVQSKNDMGKIGYAGPCPPLGKHHHYFFTLSALDTRLYLKGNISLDEIYKVIDGHVIEDATLIGTYQKINPDS